MKSQQRRMRIGIGYDSHRFGAKAPLKLGGVAIPHTQGLSGHSDADALLHAVADALFGAVGADDIGQQFPPGEASTHGVDSRLFVKAAMKQVRKAGFRVGNVDTAVIADAPKLGPHRQAIRRSIAALLGIGVEAVGMKAKTTEGFDPKGEGIAAQAVVLLLRAKAQAAKARSKQ